MKYALWGYVFRAEKLQCGLWAVVGHANGKRPYALTKLETSTSEDEMKRKLRSWAAHVMAVPVRVEADVHPAGAMVEPDLFPGMRRVFT